MALLKYSEVKKMTDKQIKEKLKDLEFEISKAYVTANKTNAKTKEIKRAIARLKTYMFSKSEKEALKAKK